MPALTRPAPENYEGAFVNDLAHDLYLCYHCGEFALQPANCVLQCTACGWYQPDPDIELPPNPQPDYSIGPKEMRPTWMDAVERLGLPAKQQKRDPWDYVYAGLAVIIFSCVGILAFGFAVSSFVAPLNASHWHTLGIVNPILR